MEDEYNNNMEDEYNNYDYYDNDYKFMMEDSILLKESIVWTYRPGCVLVTGLYLNMNDNVIEQLHEFRFKNTRRIWERLYKYIKSRGDMNHFRKDMKSTKQYMRYELAQKG